MAADVEQNAARPHGELIRELLDSRIPKSEREHAAAREIERLRAEVETLRDGLDYLRQMQGVPDVLELRAKAALAERLAEALRHQRWCRTCAEDGWESCEEGRKNDALLSDQED